MGTRVPVSRDLKSTVAQVIAFRYAVGVDTYEAFERAIQSTAGVVKGIEPGQMGDPTPCTEWDVRALLDHIVDTLWFAHASFSNEAPRRAAGSDLSAAYEEAAAAALAAAGRDGALTASYDTPLGAMPGPALAGFTTLDVFVHGWDAAKATGQRRDLDPELASHVLAFAELAFTQETRQFKLGPPVAVPEDAPVLDRLVAYLGRRP